MPRCSILAIGNEVLNGEIRDLNLYSLGGNLTHLGFDVINAVIAPDIPESIARGLAFLLAQDPDVLVCCGGLGPTGDDLTLSAIAGALSRPLVHHPRARELVETHYDQLLERGYLQQRGPEAARAKMARLPEDSEPLPNPIGTAPGVRLTTGKTLIYVLPGVPAELNAIFSATIVPELHERFRIGGFAEQAIRVHVDDEADVAIPLEQARQRHPDVYLKSLAQPFPSAGQEGLRIIATTHAATVAAATATADAAIADLRHMLEQAGLRTSQE